MSALTSTLFARSVRQLSQRHPRALFVAGRRYASNKHPKGFVPPTQADLDELRASVQEFARKQPLRIVIRVIVTYNLDDQTLT